MVALLNASGGKEGREGGEVYGEGGGEKRSGQGAGWGWGCWIAS